ncbi:MAG: GNAT family N-acetyltransferase [Pseudomonadota bacterium]
MICTLTLDEARAWFEHLPRERQIATLSPDYVAIDAKRSSALHPVFIGYRADADIWLHGTHRSEPPNLSVIDQQSPYGYGGPVSNSNDRDFLTLAWAAYLKKCTDEGILADFVRLHPTAADWQPYGGTIVADRDTVLVDTRGDFRTRYSVRCRTAVRKAEKAGLTVREEARSAIPARFADFYRNGMRAIGADVFYLFNDAYFAAIKNWDRAHLLVCEKDGVWLSAGLFLFGGNVVEYHLSATTEDGRRLAATNLLLDRVAQLAQESGLSGLYLGGGTDKSPLNPLLFFKKGFSDQLLCFRIGFTALQKRAYEELKSQYERQGLPTSRMLFYRN